MSKAGRVATGVFALIAIVIGTFLVFAICVDNATDAAFLGVQRSMSREEVIVAMGHPDKIRNGCRDAPSWIGESVPERTCASQLQYDSKLGFVFWTVGFDDRQRVIAKYHYVSP